MTARAREVRVKMMMKKTVTHFVSLALYRFTVLLTVFRAVTEKHT